MVNLFANVIFGVIYIEASSFVERDRQVFYFFS
jgi:hypothetical protein